MNQHQIPAPPLTSIRPPALRLLFHFPHAVRHPSPASLHTRGNLFLCQLHILRIDDLGAVVRFLQGGKVRVGPEKDTAVGVLYEWVVEDCEVGCVGGVRVAAVC